MFSFRLNNDFVNEYRTLTPPFGYRDGGGNSVGEITFLRTYSRMKDDGTKETWADVCERVINGMYSIQRDFCSENRLPWNDNKAQASAREGFDRLFHLKWTPPGRGLWVMGTPLINEQKNSAPAQNCFTGDTEIITRDGIRNLIECLGEDIEVWDGTQWAKATVRDFGTQPVQRITFAPFGIRSNHRVVEIATPDHRWELRDGKLTTNLNVGDAIPASAAEDNFNLEGHRHGLIFADGSHLYTCKNGDHRHIMRLCGNKAEQAQYFDTIHHQPNCDGDPVAYYTSPINMKELPASTDPAYIRSFVAAWALFDGYVNPSGSTVIATQNHEAVEWLKTHAAYAGYIITGINTLDNETNFGPRSAPLYRIGIVDTRERHYWTVKSIEPLDEPERVYCAVVPDTERFTLASGVYTSNCAFVSSNEMTRHNPAAPFEFLMEASMLGVGVGFDNKGADKGFEIHEPGNPQEHLIPDTREGWVESVKLLINSYLRPNQPEWKFDYSEVRPAGAPIKTFGGTAAGPGPLIRLHTTIRNVFTGRAGENLTRVDIADIGNLIGVCVVSGNVRRSAELLIGDIDDEQFLNLKNPEAFPERNSYNPGSPGWGWMSNNSVAVNVGDDLSGIVDAIALNGEPGVIWMDVARGYGRLADPKNNKDWRLKGFNPCVEQGLESYEACTLVETYLNRHDSLEDYKRTLKFAFLYAKTVTLMATHWEPTNAVMQRNRRIGTGMSGIANFADTHGLPTLREWMDVGYATVKHYDNVYSEWLGIRESIKVTTVKPSGSVSLLSGESPGVHWTPGGKFFLRAIRFANSDPMLPLFRAAGYRVEPASESPDSTSVVFFPIKSDAERSDKDVSIFEKASLAATAQRHWSDNSVSVTVSFDKETERQFVGTVLHMFDGQLKSVSFLPSGDETYPQMPYTQISETEYEEYRDRLMPVDFAPVYAGMAADAIGEMYCTTDACEVKAVKENAAAAS